MENCTDRTTTDKGYVKVMTTNSELDPDLDYEILNMTDLVSNFNQSYDFVDSFNTQIYYCDSDYEDYEEYKDYEGYYRSNIYIGPDYEVYFSDEDKGSWLFHVFNYFPDDLSTYQYLNFSSGDDSLDFFESFSYHSEDFDSD